MTELKIVLGGMAILLIVRESETFYLKSTTTNLWESKMSYTKNEVALETLISNINNQFYYIGEEDDKVAPIDVKKFTEHCVAFIDSLEIEK